MRTLFSVIIISAISYLCQAASPKGSLRGRHSLFQRTAGGDAANHLLTLADGAHAARVTQRGKGPDMVTGISDASDTISGHYFGHNFDSSALAFNPWSYINKRHIDVVSNLKPTAPFDRLDRGTTSSWTGAAPVTPGEDGEVFNSQMPPDWNAPYKYPHLFPEDGAPHKDPAKSHDGEVRLEDRNIIARPDVLRPNWWSLDHLGADPYPLVAPADRVRPGPYPHSIEDKVEQKYAKHFTQIADQERERLLNVEVTEDLERVDTDGDNALSWAEYSSELEGHQKKTEDEAMYLWRKFHQQNTDAMSGTEYKKMAVTGFDLGEKFLNRTVRNDVTGVLTFANAPHVGFWGSGAACAPGGFVKGVQLKVKPTGSGDNTGVNALKFKCNDGKEITTAEGPDGSWTDWAECLPGQKVYSVKARVQPFSLGQDNSGINDLSFECRSEDLDKDTKLMFSDNDKLAKVEEGYVLVGNSYVKSSSATSVDTGIVRVHGEVGINGGWSQDESCGTSAFVCGAMVRLKSREGAKDNMGITDARFMCCSKALDCSTVCQPTTQSSDCQACMAKAQLRVGASIQHPIVTPAVQQPSAPQAQSSAPAQLSAQSPAPAAAF